MPSPMGAALAWATMLRAGGSHTLSQRRHRQLLLPIPWEPDQVDTIRDAVLTLFEALREGVELQEALERIPVINDQRTRAGVSRPDGSAAPTQWGQATPRAPEAPRTWPALVESYREHKLRSGEVKPATWQRMYRPRMDVPVCFRPSRRQWATQPGCRTRQLQGQDTAAMLRWLLLQGLVGDESSSPPDLAPFIGRSRQLRTITTPMAVEHISAMVEAIPDARWRLCFQLIAACGLRPEEIQPLERRNGGSWWLVEKVPARGKTRPRRLRLLPCDRWAAAWKLEEVFSVERLAPMRPGRAAQDITQYLRRRALWMELKRDYEAPGEKLVLYSCRHAYAHRAHVIWDLPTKVVAAAMGHSMQTHRAACSRWCGDEVVDDAFAKAERRLGQVLPAQSSAA